MEHRLCAVQRSYQLERFSESLPLLHAGFPLQVDNTVVKIVPVIN